MTPRAMLSTMTNDDLNEQFAFDLLSNDAYAEKIRVSQLTPEEKDAELEKALFG